MNSHEYHPGKLEAFLILALPFIGTAAVAALAYWGVNLDVPTRM